MKKLKKKNLSILFSFIAIVVMLFALSNMKVNGKNDNEPGDKKDQTPSIADGDYSPYTGLEINEDTFNERMFAVMINNHPKARPQSGLSDADIVYEVLVEGNITRLMAVYGDNSPSKIGPVRSSRDYYLDLALGHGATYTHAGWSPQAESDIYKYNVNNINGLAYDGREFYRVNYRIAPHNMYTTTDNIMKISKAKGYKTTSSYDGFKFNQLRTTFGGEYLSEVKFPYSPGYYTSSYKYSENDKVYYRYINNVITKDETSKKSIYATNLFILFTDTKTIDSKGRLDINLIGSGTGYYATLGNYIPIIWQKDSKTGELMYLDSSGKEIELTPGKTWVNLYPTNRKNEITIK